MMHSMPSKPQQKAKPEVERVKVTAFITWAAYEAITDIQRCHRRQTGKAMRLWQILDVAVRVNAQQQGITIHE